MAQVTGRPAPTGSSTFHSRLSGVDTQQHPQHNIAPRTVRPVNVSPLGPSTYHIAKPAKLPKVK